MIHGALKLYEKDERELKLGGVFDQPRIEDVPDEFSVFDTSVITRNQGDTDVCAAVSSTSAREYQELVELDYEFLFACAKSLEEDVNSWGASLNNIGRAWVKYGCIERKDRPKELENAPLEVLRDIKNWKPLPDLFSKAAVHKAGSFMWTKGRYKSSFDNIKTWVWKFRHERRLPIIGLPWAFDLRAVFFDTPAERGNGHAMYLHPKGFVWRNGKEYMIVQNSYGLEAGENGHHYISRAVIDDGVPLYGAIMFQDLTPEQARYYQENGIRKDQNALLSTLVVLYNSLAEVLKKLIAVKKMEKTNIQKWALSIQEHEGFYTGSRSERNHNPGNIKYIGQKTATGKDKDGFAIFTTYQQGFDALCHQLTIACDGRSRVYRPDMTLYEFFAVYAPSSDNNDPKSYAEKVAKDIGVLPTIQIRFLLG